jgi:hypothetical protein
VQARCERINAHSTPVDEARSSDQAAQPARVVEVSSELRARLLAELEFSALACAAELVEVDGA